eukprot:5384911-Pyramimonas_sp.AAC.1
MQADGFPFQKSRSILELAKGVAASGHEFGTYHTFWVRSSTVGERTAVAIGHFHLLMLLHMM